MFGKGKTAEFLIIVAFAAAIVRLGALELHDRYVQSGSRSGKMRMLGSELDRDMRSSAPLSAVLHTRPGSDFTENVLARGGVPTGQVTYRASRREQQERENASIRASLRRALGSSWFGSGSRTQEARPSVNGAESYDRRRQEDVYIRQQRSPRAEGAAPQDELSVQDRQELDQLFEELD